MDCHGIETWRHLPEFRVTDASFQSSRPVDIVPEM